MLKKKLSLSFLEADPFEAVLLNEAGTDSIAFNNSFKKLFAIRETSNLTDLLLQLKLEEKDKVLFRARLETIRENNDKPLEVFWHDLHIKFFFHYNESDGTIIIHAKDLSELDALQYQIKEYTEGLVKNSVGLELSQRELEKRNAELQEELRSRMLAQELLNQSLDNLRRIIEEMIKTISLIGIIKDPYTGMHQHRVACLARAIAEDMNLHPEQIQGIYTAGMLHDIGKISIPSEILSKPGQISAVEMLLIKTHPAISYEILKQIEFPWPVARISYQHHEKLNGSGYPEGLKGDEILLEARILAVADIVEAITSHRPYREGLGIDNALQEVTKLRGICYDPEVVDICVKLFKEKRFVFESPTPFFKTNT